MDTVETLLQGMFFPAHTRIPWSPSLGLTCLIDPQILPVEAPLNANVWKVEVKQGDKIESDQVVIILEAMKLEIAVRADPAAVGTTVEKVLVQQGDSIEAGKPLLLARKGTK